MTLPSIDTLGTYGGAKQNYSQIEDPLTDRDADDANKAYASCAAMTQTAVRAWARMVCNTSTGALTLAPTNPCDATWPNTLANRPTLTRVSTGIFRLTWPTTITDDLGSDHELNFRAAECHIETAFGFTQARVVAANIVEIRLANTSGTASDFAGITVFVKAY